MKREGVPTTGDGDAADLAVVRFVKGERMRRRTLVSRLGAVGGVGVVSPLGPCRLLEASASAVRSGSYSRYWQEVPPEVRSMARRMRSRS